MKGYFLKYQMVFLLILGWSACDQDEEPFAACLSNESHPDFIHCADAVSKSDDEASTLPRLRVTGNKIVDDRCNPVILKGVSIIDPYFIVQVYGTGPDEEEFRLLAEEWGANLIRIPIHPDLWIQDENYLENYVDPYVAWGNRYGVYILLAWQAHGNVITGQADLPEWKHTPPWLGNPYNPDLTLAREAVTNMVERYGRKPWVLYNPFGEPAFISWGDWQPHAVALSDLIHKVNDRALVMISGVEFGYDIGGAVNLPVERAQIVYETHPYPWKDKSWQGASCSISKEHPVFVGEWGFDPKVSPNATAAGYGQALIDFCDQLKIGWAAYVWGDQWYPSMLNPDRTPTAFGQFVKDNL